MSRPDSSQTEGCSYDRPKLFVPKEVTSRVPIYLCKGNTKRLKDVVWRAAENQNRFGVGMGRGRGRVRGTKRMPGSRKSTNQRPMRTIWSSEGWPRDESGGRSMKERKGKGTEREREGGLFGRDFLRTSSLFVTQTVGRTQHNRL